MPLSISADQKPRQRDETINLISAAKVQGTDVYNGLGELIDNIDDVMID